MAATAVEISSSENEKAVTVETYDIDAQDNLDTTSADDGFVIFKRDIATHQVRSPSEQTAWDRESKRVAKQYDYRLLAMMCFVVGINYIDKAAIAWAALFGFEQDLKLKGQDYSWISSIFYFGYLGQIPTMYLTARVSHAKVIGVTCIAWGVLLIGSCGCRTYGSIMAVRFLLGVFEAPITPALVSYTAAFYTRKENTSRTCIWGSMQGLFYLVFSLVAYDTGHIQSRALPQWAWIFLVIGLLSIIIGLGWAFFMPDSPMSSRFLTQDEKLVAIERVADNMTGTQGHTIKPYQIVDSLVDPIYWLTILYTVISHVTNGISSFNTLVIKSFGFDQFDTLLIGLPSSVVSAGSLIVWSFIARKYGGLRTLGMSLPLIPSIIGLATVYATSHGEYNKWGRVFAYWLINSYGVCWPFQQAHMSCNFAGHTKRAFVYATTLVAFAAGNIIGPFMLPDSLAANYGISLAVLMVFNIVSVINALVIRYWMQWINRRRDLKNGPVDRTQRTAGAIDGLLDRTDSENKAFRYVL